MSRSRVFLAALGDVNDPNTWSGIPYHFLQWAQAGGVIDEGLKLVCEGPTWQRQRLTWNLWRWLKRRDKGGYQYSVEFLERLWKPVAGKIQDQTVINCFQLYAPSIVKNPRIRKLFYIDMTLLQLFDFYEIRNTIGAAIAEEALAREKQGYEAAEIIVGHSQWAAESVIRDYGIDPNKVAAIVPGANLDRLSYLEWYLKAELPVRQPGEPLKLVFIGKYWDRKGLDRLLEAIKILYDYSIKAQVIVIGCPRESLPLHFQDMKGVEWLGFIDKKHDLQRFIDIVAGADVGCLLSRAEAGGMVLREYHALGLVVLGTDVGGSAEHMFADAGYAAPPTATAQDIAAWLFQLVDHPEVFSALRERAWLHREDATWDASVDQWRTLLT